jgi:hypothetical protein
MPSTISSTISSTIPLLAALLVACAEDPPATPADPPTAQAAPSAEPAAEPTAEPAAAPALAAVPPATPGLPPDLARTTAAAKTLGKTLKGRVQQSMKADGPAATVRVCADEAQGMTAMVQAQTGVRVGRSSLKLRNPANAGPGWVQDWLRAHDAEPAASIEPLRLIVDTPEGKVARVALPVAVGAPCMVCHGPSETIPAEIRTVLDERYPDDAATGYAAGALRGAIWAEAPATGG